MSGRADREAGFTLLELLVAIAVFALMAAMAYGGLDSVMRQSELVAGEADRLARFQEGLQRLRQDLSFAIDRPVRDSRGSPTEAFVGTDQAGIVLAFTRLGAENPWFASRGQVERVEWRFNDGHLQRRAFAPVDGVVAAETAGWRTWLAVEDVDARFYDDENRAYPQWPPANAGEASLPHAVELLIVPRHTPPLRMTVALVDDWPARAPAAGQDGEGDTDQANPTAGTGRDRR